MYALSMRKEYRDWSTITHSNGQNSEEITPMDYEKMMAGIDEILAGEPFEIAGYAEVGTE